MPLSKSAAIREARGHVPIAKASPPDAPMSDEQLLAIIVQAVASMPPQHLERIEDAVEMRRSGKVVRMAAGPA